MEEKPTPAVPLDYSSDQTDRLRPAVRIISILVAAQCATQLVTLLAYAAHNTFDFVFAPIFDNNIAEVVECWVQPIVSCIGLYGALSSWKLKWAGRKWLVIWAFCEIVIRLYKALHDFPDSLGAQLVNLPLMPRLPAWPWLTIGMFTILNGLALPLLIVILFCCRWCKATFGELDQANL
ncbi:MAG: hypothetical protein ABR964_16370 [Tepidisphaeraceae bacterium]